MKVVINTKIGYFSLDSWAMERLCELGNSEALEEREFLQMMDEEEKELIGDDFLLTDIKRSNPLLVQVVEERKLIGELPALKVVDIPDGVNFYIDVDDMGVDTIHEHHRVWS